VHVISLQVGFGFGVFILFWFALQQVQQHLSESIASGIVDIVASNGTVTATGIMERIEQTREAEFIRLFVISFGAAIFFGILIMRATLSPAKNALAAQKRFIGNIAHELRTPLSIIKTNTEVLMLEHQDDKELHATLEETVSEVDRASDIINNLLSLNTYLDPGRIKFAETDMVPVVKAAVHALRQLALHKKIGITVQTKGEYHTVLGNETALEQVVINIIRNAIAHTPANGSISVTLEPDYLGSIVIAIEDTGSGIAQVDLLHIFEPYYRAESSRVRAKGGSGLGLTIVSEIVKAHRGTIAVQSALGYGTNVKVSIPCAPQKDDAGKQSKKAKADSETVTMDFSHHGAR
jgi:signal transduction histidine kinase